MLPGRSDWDEKTERKLGFVTGKLLIDGTAFGEFSLWRSALYPFECGHFEMTSYYRTLEVFAGMTIP